MTREGLSEGSDREFGHDRADSTQHLRRPNPNGKLFIESIPRKQVYAAGVMLSGWLLTRGSNTQTEIRSTDTRHTTLRLNRRDPLKSLFDIHGVQSSES